jgi:hypothetical protein
MPLEGRGVPGQWIDKVWLYKHGLRQHSELKCLTWNDLEAVNAERLLKAKGQLPTATQRGVRPGLTALTKEHMMMQDAL